MVTVKLNGTYWYGKPKKRYGPGVVEVPESLATALGLTPLYVAKEAGADTPAPVTKRRSTRKTKETP